MAAQVGDINRIISLTFIIGSAGRGGDRGLYVYIHYQI